MKLNLGYLYPKELNLYGDTGNVEILQVRARARNIDVSVHEIGIDTKQNLRSLDLLFMGGGPDSGQKNMYQDLVKNKGPYLEEYIENSGVGLFICGSFQLLGNYYKSADGTMLPGLGIFDLYTQHPGHDARRCVGNIVCRIGTHLLSNHLFSSINQVGGTLVGFENHGGRTYLNTSSPLGKVIAGHGNNSVDRTEGAFYKNAIGTYMHGPFLSKNPHIADFLIASALGVEKLKPLDDTLIIETHTALVKKFS